mmetsp:Transcript_101551/g.292573  ORF Transcript_101551/g.292573 Transcript_101551/m.292573 type:complete len:201 (-) Transcript_101551:300-902(-)
MTVRMMRSSFAAFIAFALFARMPPCFCSTASPSAASASNDCCSLALPDSIPWSFPCGCTTMFAMYTPFKLTTLSNSQSPCAARTLFFKDWEYFTPDASDMKIRPVSLTPSLVESRCMITAPSDVSSMVYQDSSSSPKPEGSNAALKVFAPSDDTIRLTVCAASFLTLATRTYGPDTKNLLPQGTAVTTEPFGLPCLETSM